MGIGVYVGVSLLFLVTAFLCVTAFPGLVKGKAFIPSISVATLTICQSMFHRHTHNSLLNSRVHLESRSVSAEDLGVCLPFFSLDNRGLHAQMSTWRICIDSASTPFPSLSPSPLHLHAHTIFLLYMHTILYQTRNSTGNGQ